MIPDRPQIDPKPALNRAQIDLKLTQTDPKLTPNRFQVDLKRPIRSTGLSLIGTDPVQKRLVRFLADLCCENHREFVGGTSGVGFGWIWHGLSEGIWPRESRAKTPFQKPALKFTSKFTANSTHNFILKLPQTTHNSLCKNPVMFFFSA